MAQPAIILDAHGLRGPPLPPCVNPPSRPVARAQLSTGSPPAARRQRHRAVTRNSGGRSGASPRHCPARISNNAGVLKILVPQRDDAAENDQPEIRQRHRDDDGDITHLRLAMASQLTRVRRRDVVREVRGDLRLPAPGLRLAPLSYSDRWAANNSLLAGALILLNSASHSRYPLSF